MQSQYRYLTALHDFGKVAPIIQFLVYCAMKYEFGCTRLNFCPCLPLQEARFILAELTAQRDTGTAGKAEEV